MKLSLLVDEGDKGVLKLERPYETDLLADVEDVKFNTGGALTMVHDIKSGVEYETACEACQ